VSRKDSLAGSSLRNLIYNLLTLENESSKFLQNNGIHLPCDCGSDLRRRESSYVIYFPLPVNTYSHYHLLLQTAKISKRFRGTQYETYTDLYLPYSNLTSHRKGVYYAGTICTLFLPVTLKL